MTIKTLAGRQVPNREIARQLDMTEGNVRYHLRRMAAGAVDGCSHQHYRAAELAEAIDLWRTDREEEPVNLADLHAWQVAEHGYAGSLRSVQRYYRTHYPTPPKRARRRRCPATGDSLFDSRQAERRHLVPLPILPQPFDQVATRTVSDDCLVSFEGRQYSVPFAWVGQLVELRGGAGTAQIPGGARVIAEHPRHTEHRLVIDPEHYEGQSTERVAAPMPLCRLGRQLQELANIPVDTGPLDLYAELAEVAR